MHGEWSAEYGTFVLCVSLVLALVAVALIAWYDHWEQVRREYITRSKRR